MTYEFNGVHYLASLYGVKDVTDICRIRAVFEKAIIQSGSSICSNTEYIFNDGGFTVVWLLKESHCSIHTYADSGNIFVDFFTCGNKTDIKKFENIILCNLELERSESRKILRS